MENDSAKAEEKVKIEDISLAYLKKVVNTIMIKFYGNNGYRHSDLVRKILRKLKCDYSQKAAARVRNQLRNWIISNNEIIKFGNVDSKKGILSVIDNSKQGIIKDQKKKKNNPPINSYQIEKPANVNNSNVVGTTTLNKEIHSDENDNSEKQCIYNNDVVVFDAEKTVLKTQECNCTCKCKKIVVDEVIVKHELIDLTIDEDIVKTENDEDDMYDINAVISQLDDYYVEPSVIYLVLH